VKAHLHAIGQAAREAARVLADSESEQRNRALLILARLLQQREGTILEANRRDLERARQDGLSEHLLDRLSLQGRVEAMANDVRAIAAYPDPIGEVFDRVTMPNGLQLYKQRTPIGVLGVIYEARPNVTIDVAALCIKTGNATILRGGKEALESNRALAETVQAALAEAGLPEKAVQLILTTERELVGQMLKLHEFIDLIIPRGGAGLHTYCKQHSMIPVITGGIGVCHLYVDADVDQEAVIPVIVNAKVQRPTVCNSLDTCLVHESIAERFLPKLAAALVPYGVSFSCDRQSSAILEQAGFPTRLAETNNWDTEWLSLVLGVKIVRTLDEAIVHIQRHSTGHSDGILTQTAAHAERFVRLIDSAAVYVNASTRFTDGAQFGLGAEVAVSTQKIHARGPMGVREITSYKWVIYGQNHVRQ
jgi:glutamate-5-semialdehyde dehydrogenase